MSIALAVAAVDVDIVVAVIVTVIVAGTEGENHKNGVTSFICSDVET